METNAQHYLNDILTLYLSGDSRCAFVRKNILNDSGCCDFVTTCSQCADRVKEWLNAQYEEPKIEVDWSKVPVDTPVLVRDKNCDDWKKRHFAKYYRGNVYTFDNGATSWSMKEPNTYTSAWAECRLAREEDVEKYCK